MHELTIAQNIIEIAEEHLKKNNATVIHEIEIEVGDVSGVVYEALEFALENTVKDTVLEKTKIKLIKIQARAKCNSCSHEFNIDSLVIPCPECGQYNPQIICGKELNIKS